MANWIETKVKYEKTLENGAKKVATEPYLVDALSFAEAEARIIEEVTPYIQGDFKVEAVKRTNILEIFFSEEASADKFYKVKAQFITLDEKTGAEKRSNANYLVQAESLENALSKFKAGMKGTLGDFEIVSMAETAIVDVIKYEQKK